MKYLKYLLFLFLIAFIAVAIYIAVQPNSFEVTRTKTIAAPASVIFITVEDFKNWESWSPWVEKDTSTNIMLDEQTKGVGGSYSWTDKEGKGKMKTLNTNPPNSIEQELQFGDYKPSKVNWTFKPNDQSETEVVWQIKSDDVPFMFKAFGIISGGFDNMIGPDFERGLEKLDSIVVNNVKQYSIKVDGITEYGGGFYLYSTTSTKIEDFEMKKNEMLPKVKQYFTNNNLIAAGAPFIIYHNWDLKNNTVMFSCAIPTTDRVITTESTILTGQLAPFDALKTTLTGNYTHLEEAWNTAMKYQTDINLVPDETGVALEVYVTDPSDTPNPADWITEIYLPIILDNNSTLSH